MAIIPDLPELLALASVAAVPASKMAAAINEPTDFFSHLSLEELARITAASARLGEMGQMFIIAIDTATEEARRVLAEATVD